MVDPDLTILTGDIRALSTLLNVADHYWWPGPSEGMDRTSFSHISTLLSFATDLPVAVTGIITSEQVNITIVQPRRRQDCPSQKQPEPKQDLQLVESLSVRPSTRSLLEIIEKRPQDLEGYTRDLIDLLRIVQSGEIQAASIIQWVIYHGWSKLHALFKESETDFKDLFGLMEAWSPGCNDPISERVINLPLAPFIYSKYPDLTVNLTDHAAEFLLNKATAPTLIKTIAGIFINMRQTLADPNGKTSEAAVSLVNPCIWLDYVLSNRYVQAVITESSLWYALIPNCRERLSVHEQSDRWEPPPGHTFRRDNNYVLRYLRRLVTCATSVFRLTRSKALPLFATATATIVSLPAPSYNAESEREKIMQAIIEEISTRYVRRPAGFHQAASAWIRELADLATVDEQNHGSVSCRLHAEACFAALACEAKSHRNDGDASDLKYGPALSDSDSSLASTPIGTSGKCCALCHRLMQALNAHFYASRRGDPDGALSFPYIPTHGKILPWDPPQFGIPRAVLTQLRNELWAKMVEATFHGATERARKAEYNSRPKEREPQEDFLEIQGRIFMKANFDSEL